MPSMTGSRLVILYLGIAANPPCNDLCVCLLCICSSKQVDLYDETFRPIVDAVLEGYNGRRTNRTVDLGLVLLFSLLCFLFCE